MPLFNSKQNISFVKLASTKTGFIDDLTAWPYSGRTGHFSFSSTGTGAVYQSYDSDSSHFGIVGLETGTTSTGYAYMTDRTVTSDPNLITNSKIKMEALIKTPSSLSDGTNTYRIRFGLTDAVSTPTSMTDGIIIEYISSSSANWRYITSKNSTSTPQNSSTAVVADTWIRLKIEINENSNFVEFFVNNTSIGTRTVDIPNATGDECGIVCSLHKTAGTSNRIMYIDYIAYQQEFTSRT